MRGKKVKELRNLFDIRIGNKEIPIKDPAELKNKWRKFKKDYKKDVPV